MPKSAARRLAMAHRHEAGGAEVGARGGLGAEATIGAAHEMCASAMSAMVESGRVVEVRRCDSATGKKSQRCTRSVRREWGCGKKNVDCGLGRTAVGLGGRCLAPLYTSSTGTLHVPAVSSVKHETQRFTSIAAIAAIASHSGR